MASRLEHLLGDGNGPAILPVRQTTGQVAVGREGLTIALTLGSQVVRFKYADAFRIGHWLMVKAHEAKMLDGNQQRIETK